MPDYPANEPDECGRGETRDEDQLQTSLDYWRLCDELNIIQAALLIVGEDPASAESYIENWDPDRRPSGYEAAKNAISKGLKSGKIEGQYVSGFLGIAPPEAIDIVRSTVDVNSLREWLSGRGFSSGFFFPRGPAQPGFLDPKNARYASKLAAAVAVWQAFEDNKLVGRSPKQALSKWLREHAAEFDLSNEDGTPNETGIEDVAKVANWQRGGGAPKTPG